MVEQTGRRPGTGMIAAFLSVALAGTLTAQAFSARPETGGETEEMWGRSRVEYASGSVGLSPARAPESTRDRCADTSVELFFEADNGTGARTAHRSLRSLDAQDRSVVRRLIALPSCTEAFIETVIFSTPTGDIVAAPDRARAIARVDGLVRIREQTVAVIEIDPTAARSTFPDATTDLWSLRVVVEPVDPAGPTCVNAGPFTRVCDRSIMNYAADRTSPAPWSPPPAPLTDGSWTVRHCFSLQDCIDAEIDVLFVAGQRFAFSGALIALAFDRASHLGLNVGIVGTAALSDLSAEALRQFLKDLYDSQSAGHFGDGRLGVVVLVGDAYANDNETVVIPSYDGYGGDETASDHYYACLSGDDEYEDIMIGRLPVADSGELVSVVGKATNYMPAAAGSEWVDNVLLLGGLFYTTKSEYVLLFDEYEELIPDDCEVDRIYRHDYSTDAECRSVALDAINDGRLIVDYVGHGSVYTWDHVLSTTHLDQFENPAMLPIVLSMTCQSGWFDNTTSPDANGSYDCLAEQLVLAPGGGAIACLAASRASDGGSYRTLTKKFYQAAFHERCLFLGEAIGVAKLLHLQDGGSITYARHYNLFGDPSLVFLDNSVPTELPDLAIRPHEVVLDPKYPKDGDDLTLTVPVRNLSACPLTNIKVMLDGDSDTGPYRLLANIPNLAAWSSETVEFNVPSVVLGSHTMMVEVDPRFDFDESDETNNWYYKAFYTYPHAEGFPVELGAMTATPTIATLGDARCVVAADLDGQAYAIDSQGAVSWQSSPATPPLVFGPEVAPAAGDIDGDGINEVITTTRMGLSAFDLDGTPLWYKIIDDAVGSPSIADADGDGLLDVIVATKDIFWGGSEILAKDKDGTTIWIHPLPDGVNATTPPAIADCDLDGVPDIIYGASDGAVRALSCATNPPTELWPAVSCGQSDVAALALADVDEDGYLDIMAGGDVLSCINAAEGTRTWSFPLGADVICLAAGNLDADTGPEIVVGTAAGVLMLVYSQSPGWYFGLDGAPGSSAAIGDVDGDGENEILVGTSTGNLYVITSDASNLVSPLPITSGGPAPTPYVADLNGDGTLEVAVGSSDEGLYFVFDFGDAGTEPSLDWAGLGGFESHRSLLSQPLHGDLSGNITLTGRSLVTDDLRILPGGKLTLSAESELEFDADAGAELEIQGELVAAGRPGFEVLIHGGGGRGGLWEGIKLEPGSTTEFTSCRIIGARTAISGVGADLTLKACDISEGLSGMYLADCSVDAYDSSVVGCDSLGATFVDGTGTIRACSFEGNGRGGVRCDDALYSFYVTNFDGTLAGSGLTCDNSSNAVIDSCSFIGNAEHGVQISESHPRIEDSIFTANQGSGIFCKKNASPTVSWCQVEGNGTGVRSEGRSKPNLGSDGFPPCEGHNSISGNTAAAVANCSGGYTVSARHNWWGVAPPNVNDFIGSIDYSAWLISPPPRVPTSVTEGSFPTSYRLEQNTPNPFNPSTTIRYEVPTPGGHIEISVYDVAGRLVETLLSDRRAPGGYEVVWDGRDSRGFRVASGIYFARMRAAEFISSRKMILLK